MNKKQKKVLIRVIVASVLLILCAVLPTTGYVRFATFMVPYLVIGYDILKKAWKGILNKQVFDENFLMAVATVGAILLGEYPEGVAVMLFYQIGELFQSYAVGKSRRNISELMDIRPDYANIEVDGKLEQVDPDEVEVGTINVVQPGEKIPIDGVIEEGNTTLNTSALTGDSKRIADQVAADLRIDEVYSELLPGDKVSKVEELLAAKTEKEKLAFVGDGINDAPVLSRADIGIAMGALGSDAAIEAADIVLMDDDPLKISKAIHISRKCIHIVYENIYFAIGIKVLFLLLGAIGIANMWMAIFADVGVMILAVLNAIRALFVKNL